MSLGAIDSATVTVLVRSLSGNSAPSFDVASYEFTVSDSGVVGTVIASDAENDGVSYSLSIGDTGLFSVGVTDGEIIYNGGEVDSDTNYTLVTYRELIVSGAINSKAHCSGERDH